SYAGNVDAVSVGKNLSFSPGASPAQVTINGDFSLNSGDTLSAEINGLGIANYDNLIVNGAVSLGAGPADFATLNLSTSNGFTVNPALLQSFTLISNDAADAVSGIFNGLPENSAIVVPTLGTLFINYHSGTNGNDIVLSSQLAVNGTSGDDSFLLTRDPIVA